MFALILMVIFGIMVAYFATLNTTAVVIHLLPGSTVMVPLYAVVLFSILFGFFVAWIVSTVQNVSSFFILRRKDRAIEATRQNAQALEKRVKDLEIENSRLKANAPRTSIIHNPFTS